MADYKPFPITELQSGISTYVEPWIRPQDAFDPLINAYIYRGTLNKRNGYVQFGNTLADNNPVMGLMRYIDQTTSTASLLAATTVNLYLYDAGTNTFGAVGMPPTFTGTIQNFFNWTNWQPTSGSTSLLWMCNNKDAVTTFDGTNAAQPTITIDGSGTTITTAQDIKVYKQRLLLIRPTLSSGGIQNQSIYWSAITNPSNWLTDTAGAGGFLAAPTGDTIVSAQFIRDVLVVFFTNSTWIFRYTGIDTNPFRWDKLNDSKSSNAPYGSVPYDQRCTSIGATGLIACDGVNVQRYDIPIIDYYETEFSQRYFAQSFSQRYDNLNQAWTLYVSNGTTNPLVGGVAPGADRALVYNFLENTWATYEWSIPLTCLGLFYAPEGLTWQDLVQTWDSADFIWKAYDSQQTAPILLAGDTTGHVYWMDYSASSTDQGTEITPDITSTKWNPFLGMGQKTQFGYIDFYYSVVSSNPADPVQLTLSFYVDNSQQVVLQKTLTLDGPASSGEAFKRIYLNLVGEFVQMNIDSPQNAAWQINGFVLWARPAGRLTPP